MSDDEPFGISSDDECPTDASEDLSGTETEEQEEEIKPTFKDAVSGKEVPGAETNCLLPDPVKAVDGEKLAYPKEPGSYIAVKLEDGSVCPAFVSCKADNYLEVTVHVIQGAQEQKKAFKEARPKKPLTPFLASDAKALNEGDEKKLEALKKKYGDILMGDALIKEVLEKKKKRKAPTVLPPTTAEVKKEPTDAPAPKKPRSLFGKEGGKAEKTKKCDTASGANVKIESTGVFTPICPGFPAEDREATLTPSEIGMVKKLHILINSLSTFLEN